jgi:hypothetical protein
MYECLLPSTFERVEVRGLTLRQLVELQSSVFIEHTNLYVVLIKLARLIHQSITAPLPFEEWVGTISDQDLHSLVFGLYRDTFGPELQLTLICPSTQKQQSQKINLDTQLQVTTATDQPIDVLQKSSLDITIGTRTFSITYRPFRLLEDQLCAYHLTGLALDLSTMSKDELSLLALKVPTILQIASDLGTWKRPPCTVPLNKMREWFIRVQDILGQLPVSQLSSLEPTEPPTIDFKLKYVCSECGEEHTESLNFFQHLLERLVS